MIDPLVIPLAAIGGAALVFFAWIALHYYYSGRQRELDAKLKFDMLERGMSVADIERLLQASSERVLPEPTRQISESEYMLITHLLEAEKSVEEIERLLLGLRGERGAATVRNVVRSQNVALPG